MKYKPKVAIVRGKFLNKYEMQFFEPLTKRFDLVGFGSYTSFHNKFNFPVIKLLSPMDMPDFPLKMPVINRLFIDAHYLVGLEGKLTGFDIAHSAETYFHYTAQCLNAKRKGYVKKVIATISENIPFNNEGIWGRKKLKRKAINDLDHFIARTKMAKDVLILEGADPKKITIIGHAIDTLVFKPNLEQRTKNKEHRNINVLFVGRLEEHKGVYEILYAIKKLVMDENFSEYNLIFTMVGNGTEKEKLLKLAKKLKIEKFIVHKEVSYEKINKEYEDANIFIAPSKPVKYAQEQFSVALLEAQSCGLPIVTTPVGGIPENVGNAAIFAQPADFDSLAAAIKRFILSLKLRNEYGKIARKRAVEVHDIKIAAKKLADLYAFLLKG